MRARPHFHLCLRWTCLDNRVYGAPTRLYIGRWRWPR